MQARLNQQNARFSDEEEIRHRQMEDQIRERVRDEQRRMEIEVEA